MKKWMISIISFLMIIMTLPQTQAFAENKPSVGAESYIAIDADSGRIILSKDMDKKKYMASTTKIMTAILAIENIENLEQEVTIPAICTGIEGSSIYLKPNQKAKMIDLLYGVMLRSGNDAAATVAYYAGGKSVENFVSMMNEKAKEIGAYNTHFTNPHGLQNENHYTTAYDLALITKYAMQNETFKKIVGAKKYINSSNNFYFFNKNKVINQYKYGTGVKIGYTKAAGRCLVASAKKDDMEVIVVVLNDGNWFNDSYHIFDYAFEKFDKYNIVDKNQFMLNDSNGKHVLAQNGFRYILTEDEIENLKIEIVKSIPHITNNFDYMVYGFYNIKLNGETIYTDNLVYAK